MSTPLPRVFRMARWYRILSAIALVRTRRYPRADLESAKVDGGAVCLKKRDGGWLVLPDTGRNTLAVRNTIHAWIRSSEGKDS